MVAFSSGLGMMPPIPMTQMASYGSQPTPYPPAQSFGRNRGGFRDLPSSYWYDGWPYSYPFGFGHTYPGWSAPYVSGYRYAPYAGYAYPEPYFPAY